MRHRLPVVFALVAAFSILHASGMVLMRDVPSPERQLTLAATSSHDRAVTALSDGADTLLVLALEDHRLIAQRSSDRGIHFDPPQVVYQSPSGLPVRSYAATRSASGEVFVAFLVGHENGDHVLRFTASGDMGATWRAPVEIAGPSNVGGLEYASYRPVSIATGPRGLVSVLFAQKRQRGFYVVTSGDGGATWRWPVQVDTDGGDAGYTTNPGFTLAYDPAGRLHVLFLQPRPPVGTRAWYTWSDNDGVSFATERDLGELVHPGVSRSVYAADLGFAKDGFLIVALAESGYRTLVLRSTDGGLTFAQTGLYTAGSPNICRRVTVGTNTADATVLVAVQAERQPALPRPFVVLDVLRSHDSGATFAAPVRVADAAQRGPVPIVRVAENNWAVAFTDGSADTYTMRNDVVLFSTSTDDGQSWTFPQRVDGAPAPSRGELTAGGMIRLDGDEVFFAWADYRRESLRSADVWVNRATSDGAKIGIEERIDTDEATIPVETFGPSMASAGDHAYAAIAARAFGPHSDVFLVHSADRGYTWGPPSRIGSHPPGSLVTTLPVVQALDDGHVWVFYQVDLVAPAGRELRVARSLDFGATWVSDESLGPVLPCSTANWTCYDQTALDVKVSVQSRGKIDVVWVKPEGAAGQGGLAYARSTDYGETFTVSDADGGVADVRTPAMCTRGAQVVIAYQGGYMTGSTVHGLVSTDDGASFGPVTRLDSGPDGNWVTDVHATCSPSSWNALVTWADARDPDGLARGYVQRWDGSTWSGDRLLDGLADVWFVRGLFLDETRAVVAMDSNDGHVWTMATADAGTTFTGPFQIDSDVPNIDDLSSDPRLLTDGTRVWVLWGEFRASAGDVVARRSVDGGVSWDGTVRLDQNPVDGVFRDDWQIATSAAVFPSALLVTWTGERRGPFVEWMVNAYDGQDMDRDGADSMADCNDEDNGARTPPGEIPFTEIRDQGPSVLLRWAADTEAGTTTRYDVAKGSTLALLSSGSFADAACFSGAQQGTEVLDYDTPLAGDAAWYLVRAQNSCGISSFGDAGSGDARAALDQNSPCP